MQQCRNTWDSFSCSASVTFIQNISMVITATKEELTISPFSASTKTSSSAQFSSHDLFLCCFFCLDICSSLVLFLHLSCRGVGSHRIPRILSCGSCWHICMPAEAAEETWPCLHFIFLGFPLGHRRFFAVFPLQTEATETVPLFYSCLTLLLKHLLLKEHLKSIQWRHYWILVVKTWCFRFPEWKKCFSL